MRQLVGLKRLLKTFNTSWAKSQKIKTSTKVWRIVEKSWLEKQKKQMSLRRNQKGKKNPKKPNKPSLVNPHSQLRWSIKSLSVFRLRRMSLKRNLNLKLKSLGLKKRIQITRNLILLRHNLWQKKISTVLCS
jgi:hypothetical protein